jgi:tetrapyrrole methylase family protein/MazG family protein
VVLQAQVAADKNHFSLVDVISFLNHKMKQRHPHVFGELKTKDLEEIWNNWEKQKAKEIAEKKEAPKSIFNIPKSLPALQTAYKIGLKTEAFNFDWKTPHDLFTKVSEEHQELAIALKDLQESPSDAEKIKAVKHEIGDLLFSLAQMARHLDMEPEQILREANLRFRGRFETMINLSHLDRESFRNLSPVQKEELWRQAKIEHKSRE